MAFLSKYGTARHIYIAIPKAGSANHAVGADWTPAAGDVKISKDGGAAANVTNLPTAIAMGNSAEWDFSITATEMQAAQIVITVSDSATKAVDDTGFIIETYGNASAQHPFDLGTASTAQTGDNYARLGAPAGASVSADIAGIQSDTNDIQTRLPAALVTGRMDSSVGAYQTGLTPLQPTVAGRTLDVSATGESGLDWANIGSPTTAVNLSGTSTKALEPTTAGRTLDVTVTGAAGIDWANVENPTTILNLSSTSVKTATDVETDTQDIQSRIPAALVSGRIDASVGAYQAGLTPLQPTVAGRTLDVTALGNAAIDWGNLENPTASQSLTNTTVGSVNDMATVSSNVQVLYDSVVGAVGTIVDAAATTTSFKTSLTNTDGWWDDALITFFTNNVIGQTKPISAYVQLNGLITLDEALTVIPQNGSGFYIVRTHVHPVSQIAAGVRDVDNTSPAASSLGADVNSINAKTTNLPVDPADASDIAAEFSSLQTHGDTTWSTVSAAAIRTAVGMASANLDTQLDALPTAAENATAVMTTQMTESYAANGVSPTVTQALMAVHQMLMQFSIAGTSITVKKLDNATTAFIVTLNDATTPTAAVRT